MLLPAGLWHCVCLVCLAAWVAAPRLRAAAAVYVDLFQCCVLSLRGWVCLPWAGLGVLSSPRRAGGERCLQCSRAPWLALLVGAGPAGCSGQVRSQGERLVWSHGARGVWPQQQQARRQAGAHTVSVVTQGAQPQGCRHLGCPQSSTTVPVGALPVLTAGAAFEPHAWPDSKMCSWPS